MTAIAFRAHKNLNLKESQTEFGHVTDRKYFGQINLGSNRLAEKLYLYPAVV